ncbi:MAG TPA: glycosyltransferase family 4 protein [archaeon]|nr:glycosyltransferase family 4 protein [archaeon]
MRIVQVVNHFSPCVGGMERVVYDIGVELAERGHNIKVVCLNRCANSNENLSEKEKVGKVFVERIPFLNLKYYKIAFGVFGKIKDTDVVHVHGIGFFSDFLIATKFLHKKKVVVSTHGGVFHTENIGFLKKIYFNFLQRLLLRFADKMIAVSKNDFELFKKITNNVVLVENGINVSDFTPGKKQKNSFLFVGRFSKNKRVELLLDAFSKVEAEFSLIIAGVDWENLLKKYREKVSELGLEKKVSFAINPSAEELRALYASSEFFVSASQYEGFGLALAEAMASGCIPIVQENEGFSQILSGKQGFLADFEDAKKTAAEIEKAMKLSAKEKNELGKSFVLRAKDFSWETRIKELERIYGGRK